MSRVLNKLTARQVSALKAPGRHSDGGGLYLRVTPHGARSWVFMITKAGKRTEIGLGPALTVSLSTARGIAGSMRDAVAAGGDPREVIELQPPAEASLSPLFGDFAKSYIESIESGWRNQVHRQQWRNSLRDHAYALDQLAVDQIKTDHVLAVLQPIWTLKPETAKRVRGRIERILDAAKARGLRPSDAMNPAAWRGHLALLLPPLSKLSRGHHAALAWKDAPRFLIEIRKREAVAARCLEFVILTAARSGEALGATWGEIDLEERLWTVSAARMKAGIEHVVPLSSAAVELLSGMKKGETSASAAVFAVKGSPRSNMAMTMLLRRMQRHNVTVHGFRSTFRD
ncbi:MAG TPA: integrase arm-type DNA-binding domain-containing protein, partial [Sphingomicrobium sp.]|nr:integrase arm-type DNA-binding domain-containing protein [Sphingomicrobium sp.]